MYSYPRYSNEDLTKKTLDDLTEQCSQDILCALLEEGGKGLKMQVAKTIALAISRQDLLGNMKKNVKHW